ncbi:MAG: Arylsulfatase, partial [Bacteroidota bacterium]
GLSPERLADLTARKPRIWELRTRVKALAKVNEVYFFDLTKLFRNKAGLITPGDGVHPNTEGYRFLATELFRYLVKKDIIEKP